MKWNGHSVVCEKCWDKEPWFLKKLPRLPNELAPVNNPSLAPDFTFLTDGVTWDTDNTIWELDVDAPMLYTDWDE